MPTRQDPTGELAARGPRVVKIPGVFSLGTGNASLFSWQNPENMPILVTCAVHVTTQGSAGDAVTIGVVANGTGAGTNVMTSLGITVSGTVINGWATGTGIQMMAEKGGTNDYLTGKVVSAGTGPAGTAVADVYVIYFPTVFS